MALESDYADLLRAFNDNGVAYLVVGAHAVGYHAEPRATLDFDVWIERSPHNAKRVFKALASFGAPLDRIKAEDFERSQLVFQVGIQPLRIDILTDIDGVNFEDAYKTRVNGMILDVPAPIIGRAALIANKRAAGRDKDFVDLRRLER